MRPASRFVLLRWQFVRRQSSHRLLRLQRGLITTAQGGTLTCITASGTTLIVIIGTWRAYRAGSAASRKWARRASPTPTPAFPRVLLPAAWPHRAGSVHRTLSPRRADTSAAIPPAVAACGAHGS